MARMKRYTRLRGDHRAIYSKELSRDEKGDFIGPAVDRLAAYEDTGMSPPEVIARMRELIYTAVERDKLLQRVKDLESDVAATKSEREYFRSRAEFFRELAENREKSARK